MFRRLGGDEILLRTSAYLWKSRGVRCACLRTLLPPAAIVFVLLALTALVITSRDTEEVRKPPAERASDNDVLRCDENVFDLGDIPISRASNLGHIFTVTNTAAYQVTISDVVTSCGCAAAEVFQKTIPAGGLTEVSVTADWSERIGDRRESVLLKADAPDSSELLLVVHGRVIHPVSLEPDAVDFGRLAAGEMRKRRVELVAAEGDTPIQPSTIIITIPHLAVSPASQHSDARGLVTEYELIMNGPMESGADAGAVTFLFADPPMPAISLPVTAQYQGAMTASPPMLLLRGDSGDECLSKIVRISSEMPLLGAQAMLMADTDGVNPFEIEQITCKAENDTQMAVTVAFWPSRSDRDSWRGRLRVSTDQTHVDVPIVGIRNVR